jgi:hypothetical protein
MLGLTAHTPRDKAAQPIPGVTEWTNPKNGVHVVEVHYTADPAKRDPAWLARAKQGMPTRGWLREFEISWEVPDGEPVFPEYQPATMRREVRVNPSARLLRFWDFGHVCPVTLFAQLDLWGRLCVVAELVLEYTSLEQQVQSTKAMTLELMGQPVTCFDAGDPAGEKEVELGQVKTYLMRQGIVLNSTPSNQGSYENLRLRMSRNVRVPGEEGTSPALLVSPQCAILNTALSGGFHRNPKTGKVVDVHPYKDVCDALRYGNDNLVGAQSEFAAQLKKVAMADCAW